MAHFIAYVRGQRGEASRLGSKTSGMHSTTASWQGSVTVELYEKAGVDYALVSLNPWKGQGSAKMIYDGPVSGAPIAS